MSPKESLAEAFRACYYARDPVMLDALMERASDLEADLRFYAAEAEELKKELRRFV